MPPASPPGSEEGLATPGWGTVGSPLCPQACCAGMENGYQSPRKRPKRAGRTLPPVKMIPIPTPVLETCLVQFFSVALASRCGSVPWEAPSFPAPTPRVPMSPRTCVPRALSGLIPALGALCSPASRWSSAYNKGITRCCWCFSGSEAFSPPFPSPPLSLSPAPWALANMDSHQDPFPSLVQPAATAWSQ